MARDPNRYLIDGERVPSVTEILSMGGWVDYSGVDPEVLAKAATRGTWVHEATERVDDGTFDAADAPRPWLGYVRAYQRFCQEHDYTITGSEEVVLNSQYLYAGTLDRRAMLNGWPTILDIKTSYKPGASWGPQIAGYAACMTEQYARAALWLRWNGEYELIWYKDPDDRRLFLATAFLVGNQIRRGVRRAPWDVSEELAKN